MLYRFYIVFPSPHLIAAMFKLKKDGYLGHNVEVRNDVYSALSYFAALRLRDSYCWCYAIFLQDVLQTYLLPNLLSSAPSFGPSSGFSGLVNQTNTCYLNSLTQLLALSPEIRHLLFSLAPKDLVSSSIELRQIKKNTFISQRASYQ